MPTTPRRSRSLDALLRQPWLVALVALGVVLGAVVSDAFEGNFWAGHALLTSMVGSVIVVMLSIAVINELLERRRRRRWSILAQYVMFELIRNARMIWSSILEFAGLLAEGSSAAETLELNRRTVRDAPRLAAGVRGSFTDGDRFASFRSEVAFLAEHSDEVLGRWAGIMLGSEIYSEVIDRHVELGGDISWIAGLFDANDPPGDTRRRQRARSSAAVAIEAQTGGDWMADRIAVVAQLAETLDRSTLELALRIVPVDWWEQRLGTVQHSE